MTICILTPRFPFPENGGDVLRINNIARHLRAQGHRLVLVSFCEEYPDLGPALELFDKVYVVKRRKLQSIFFTIWFMFTRRPLQCGYYYSASFLSLLKQVITNEKPDLFISHLLRMSPYLEKCGVENKSIVEMTDALSKTYAMSKRADGISIKKIAYMFEHNLIKKYEKSVLKKFPKVVLVSSQDVDYLRALVDEDEAKSLAMHTNGINCPEIKDTEYDRNKICFVGNMRTLQNQDAVIYFIEEIFPLVLKKMPDAKFYIVGAQPPAHIRNLASKNIIVTGFVENLRDEISDACVAVAPVRIASGIQNKILMAMSCNIPVVLTPLISQSIPELHNGKNCYVCEDKEVIAQRCIRLMKDARLRAEIAKQGYETVRNFYTWEEKLSGYEKIED